MTAHYTDRELRAIDAFANFHMTRQDAEEVACEQCTAAPGQTCRNPDTGEPVPYPAHWIRIRTADQQRRTTTCPAPTRSARTPPTAGPA